ncbi:FH2 domain-containing protein 1-like isoform X2 [Syngnathoides biaculeatus]|uniref:FH2 domain-containing protein 1-like isoform X2 n=1 Tax=Syngnathoides biaculeatus TaxID=300417 RepID=UPI002ADDBE56|nr:FH2 domain-containing protein 1-like isoform X2 [Syngnathoides biaculeatus]
MVDLPTCTSTLDLLTAARFGLFGRLHRSELTESATSSSLGGIEAPLISSPEPLPRPPPPPPPPPPPLPRLPPQPSSFQRRSMKKFYWDAIPSQRVLGRVNVWTSELPPRELVLDTLSMDELFGRVDHRPAGVGRRRARGTCEVGPHEPQVGVLDSRKSMNIGILLKCFKRPAAEMVDDIVRGDWRGFGDGKLSELCKLLPDQSEVERLLSYDGNPLLLPEADRFMVQLVKVPHYEELLKVMVLRQEFSPLLDDVNRSLNIMIKAANELLDCDDLHSVIRLVLKAGNYMNAGGHSADAIGFRMASLLKMADTKANKPGMNLMHYVAKQQADDIDADLLTFPGYLEHIGAAARICKEDVVADLERQVEKLNQVKLHAAAHSDLRQQMEPFLEACEAQLCDANSLLRELEVLSCAVAEFFCEDPRNFELAGCCSIFHSFCRRFETAVQENRKREAAEQRLKRKESFRQTAKRGPATPVPESGLESALHRLLSAAPEGPSAGRSRKNTQPLTPGPPVESPEKKQAKREEVREGPSTPCTPRPRTRDVFSDYNGDGGSPWTVLSPLTCSRRRRPQRGGASDANDPDDGVWESAFRGPRGRSASVDSTRQTPLPATAAASRLRTLFQRAAPQRSYSSGSGTDTVRNPAASFHFISFFRRFGGKKEARQPDVRPTDLEQD